MNHNPDIGQNLASGAGLLPVCALFMIMSVGPAYASNWVRIGINSLAALVSLLLCYAIFGLLRDRNAGHRWLHGYMLLAFACRAAVHGWVAWKWIAGENGHLPLLVAVLQSTTEIVFGLYFYTTRHDLQITYRRSEEQRRANLHRIEQAHQAALILEYKVKSSLENTHRLRELITDVGRGR